MGCGKRQKNRDGQRDSRQNYLRKRSFVTRRDDGEEAMMKRRL